MNVNRIIQEKLNINKKINQIKIKKFMLINLLKYLSQLFQIKIQIQNRIIYIKSLINYKYKNKIVRI